jgi:hypothetical protein
MNAGVVYLLAGFYVNASRAGEIGDTGVKTRASRAVGFPLSAIVIDKNVIAGTDVEEFKVSSFFLRFLPCH